MSRRPPYRPHAAAYPFFQGIPFPGRPRTLPGGSRDPEENRNAPELEDPEENRNAPELEDPEENRNAPELEDPDGFPFPQVLLPPYGFPYSVAPTVCCCDDREGEGEVSGTQGRRPERFSYSGFVILRLVPGIEPDVEHQTLEKLVERDDLDGLRAALRLEETGEEPRFIAGRVLVRDDCGGLVFDGLRELERQAATGPFPPLRSLLSYWRLDLREVSEDRQIERVERLRGLPSVAYAYRELAAVDAADKVSAEEVSAEEVPAEEVPAETSAVAGFRAAQGYLEAAPVGLGARWARDRLGTVDSKIRAVDLEQRWATKHQDITRLPGGTFFGHNRAKLDRRYGHGTAVCGQLIGDGRVEGIAEGLLDLSLASHYDRSADHNGNVAEAIVRSILPFEDMLGPGDLLLLEVQRSFYPTEIDDADFDAVRLAVSRGIAVFEAAGNGGWDLDAYVDPRGRSLLARDSSGFRDSGAILVGAARSALPHDRLRSSNYGCRVDVYGWGEDVFTSGYGDFDPGGEADRRLTGDFRGTSAAAAMIAGAGALVQCLYRSAAGDGAFLEPARLRQVLADPATGTPQGSGVPGAVGVMPDLRAVLQGDLGLLAGPFARRGHDDACERRDLWSSPDLLLPASGEPPGPGGSTPLDGRGQVEIHIRLHNRGSLDAEGVRVELFHGPPATLIAPGAWRSLGHTTFDVPRGLDGTLSPPVPWQPPADAAEHPSLLALIAGPGERIPVLPRGRSDGSPSDGTWTDYLELLGSDAAVCTNVHRVEASRPRIDFAVTGAPDRLRIFEWEVIQRLPAGVRVRLEGLDPYLFLALSRGLGRNGGIDPATNLDLPSAPRIRLEGVRLPPRAFFPATLVLSPTAKSFPPNAFERGASVIVRQLFREQEVGRITFIFR